MMRLISGSTQSWSCSITAVNQQANSKCVFIWSTSGAGFTWETPADINVWDDENTSSYSWLRGFTWVSIRASPLVQHLHLQWCNQSAGGGVWNVYLSARVYLPVFQWKTVCLQRLSGVNGHRQSVMAVANGRGSTLRFSNSRREQFNWLFIGRRVDAASCSVSCR